MSLEFTDEAQSESKKLNADPTEFRENIYKAVASIMLLSAAAGFALEVHNAGRISKAFESARGLVQQTYSQQQTNFLLIAQSNLRISQIVLGEGSIDVQTAYGEIITNFNESKFLTDLINYRNTLLTFAEDTHSIAPLIIDPIINDIDKLLQNFELLNRDEKIASYAAIMNQVAATNPLEQMMYLQKLNDTFWRAEATNTFVLISIILFSSLTLMILKYVPYSSEEISEMFNIKIEEINPDTVSNAGMKDSINRLKATMPQNINATNFELAQGQTDLLESA